MRKGFPIRSEPFSLVSYLILQADISFYLLDSNYLLCSFFVKKLLLLHPNLEFCV